jgi:DNA-binding IclR family transcriptional regulator
MNARPPPPPAALPIGTDARPPASDGAPRGAAAVDRALSLLAAFREGDDALSLAELARRTGLYKSTALRLLHSLEQARMLRRDAAGYALGLEIARLGRLQRAGFSPEQVVLPALQALVRQTGESAAYHVRRDQVRLCQFRVDSPHPIRDHIRAGDVLPLDQGSGGRVLVAFDPKLGAGVGRKDRALLARIRADGYCALQGDRLAEVAGISAPVFGADGQLAAALTLTMPVHRYDDRHIAAVLAAARALSATQAL